jgi:hypothetical protein
MRCYVHLGDIVQIIFEELDPVWLKSMWDGDEDIRCNMLEIIHFALSP